MGGISKLWRTVGGLFSHRLGKVDYLPKEALGRKFSFKSSHLIGGGSPWRESSKAHWASRSERAWLWRVSSLLDEYHHNSIKPFRPLAVTGGLGTLHTKGHSLWRDLSRLCCDEWELESGLAAVDRGFNRRLADGSALAWGEGAREISGRSHCRDICRYHKNRCGCQNKGQLRGIPLPPQVRWFWRSWRRSYTLLPL